MPSRLTNAWLRPGVAVAKSDLQSALQTIETELNHGGFFTRVGATAADIHVADRIGQAWVSVTDFGAARGGLNVEGADSTTAIQEAIDTVSNELGGGTVYLPPGVWWMRGIRMAPLVTLCGAGWSSVLKLLPGSDQHVVRQSDTLDADGKGTDAFYTVCNLAIDGNRDAQSADRWTDGIHFEMTTDGRAIHANPKNLWGSFDPQHRISNVHIRDCQRDGIWLQGRGGHLIDNIAIGQCTRFGMYNRAWDNAIVQCYVGGTGADGFRVSGGPNKHTNCKAFFTGQATSKLNDGSVTGEGVSPEDWRFGVGFFVEGQMNSFMNCEAQDTWSHGVVIGGKEGIWHGHISQAGALRKHHGLGAEPPLPEIAGFFLRGDALDNEIRGIVRDQFVRNGTGGPYATHAVLWGEGASGNEIHLRIPTGHVASGAAHNETASIQASNWITYRGP